MDAGRWAAARALFEDLVERTGADRASRLAQARIEDAEVAAAAEQLLAGDAETDTEHWEVDQALRAAALQAGDAAPGMPLDGGIGPWRMLRELGSGGMGTVYLAERESQGVRQQAAVKLLRIGHGGAEARRRFLAEQRMLARLHHTHIAHLIEGGIGIDGTPYLALEYVEGTDLLSYARTQRLGPDARIRLFLAVCAAVEHAHQRLIVHRDLKPGNILVTADGTVKLLDFGIGKLLDDLDDGSSAHTATGLRLYTLGYAAPEQLRGEPVSTATDVYALGVVLYKLLTGHLPFAVQSHSAMDWERVVLTQEPTPPSRREPLPSITGASGPATIEWMPRDWRGDLDAILLKALRREPELRYVSVGALRDDLLALLAQRPVAARRGSRRYRLGKFLRRNALVLSLSSVAVVGLLVGTALALWQARQARAERAQAQESSRRAEATVEFLTTVFDHADPARTDGADPTASSLLAAGETQLRAATDLDAATRTSLLIAMARAYRGLNDSATYLRLMQEAQPHAVASRQIVLQVDALIHLGVAYNNTGNRDAAITQYAAAETLLRASGLHEPVRQARIDYLMATELNNLDRPAEALTRIARAHRVLVQTLGAGAQQVALCLDVYVLLLKTNGRATDGVEVTRQSAQAAADPTLPKARRAMILGAHAMALLYAGRLDEAEPIARETLRLDEAVFGTQHGDLIGALSKLMVIQSLRGQHAEARQLGERLLAIRRSTTPAPSGRLSSSLSGVARTAIRAGDWAYAGQLLDEAIAGHVALQAPRSTSTLQASFLRAQVYLGTGDQAEARRLLQGLAPYVQQLGIDDRPVARRLLAEQGIADASDP